MIVFYDYEFNLLLVEPKVISWKLVKYFNETGTFTAHLPLSSRAVELVAENDYLVCEVGGEFAVVTGKEIAGELVLYGRTPNWLLSGRVVMPFAEKSCKTGELVRDMFDACYADCPDVVFGEMVEGETHTRRQDSPKKLSLAVFDALGADRLGNEFLYDKNNRRWVFNLLCGRDLPLMISEANKNAASVTVTENIAETANFCYYRDGDGFVGKGERRDGLYHFETYVISDDEGDADEALKKAEKERKVTADTVGVIYRKDYLLGDTVRVQIIKGGYRTTERLRICGVEMNFSAAGYTEKPIFENIN